ncbi:MAG TPA: beta-L-arabinofuranosidase domain-containing protein [Puia sp.]|nr:beta-L-arabinofuranosidase domain-containing protein [Puia sp.]
MKRSICLLTTLITLSGLAQSYVPEYGNKKVTVDPVTKIQAYPFDLKDVRLLAGPFKQAMEADAAYLREIEPDRLLSEFRHHSGLEPKGAKYGGWESSGLAGHTLGHYLSACSMEYAATGDTFFLHRVNYIVSELAACQKARKTGYIGAIPREDTLWSEVAAGHIRSHGFDLNGAWSPWYTVHKVMAGLLDAYLYCDNTQALTIEKSMADWTATIVGHLADSTLQKMLACEYGGMNDVLANTYAITGEKKYLDLSYTFHDKRILDSLSRGLDDLAGKHSNTQIPKVIGCARRYELTADDRDRQIAESFWSIIVNDHTYATGGNSDYEYLGPARKLDDELTENTTETCNTYNMLKLTRHLFAWHPSASLMDYYEKALYNHILASQEHATGMMTYFVPLRMGGHKTYSTRFDDFTCCVGSGMENHVKYGESIYSRGGDGSLYVNLFIPSELNWRDRNITVRQTTKLPANGRLTLTITAAQPTTFTLRIRKPRWATNPQPFPVGEDGYLQITRTWKGTETVELHFDESFYTESIPDNPSRIALFYGPILLAGELGNAEPDPVKGIPVLVNAAQDPNQWVRRISNDSLIFKTADITLIPFNQTANEYYCVYWDAFTPTTWAIQQQKYAEERKKEQELESRTIDRLRLGEMQPERDHSFTGESLLTGEEHGKKWRSTGDGGWFSFTMKVDSASANNIRCAYWGDDHRQRIFDIQIDGQTIATQDLNKLKQSKFYEINYPIPAELTHGKQTVTVKFAAHSPRTGVGPVSGTIRFIAERSSANATH